MDKLIFLLSLWFAKLISFLILIFHLGQSSNFPGKVVLLFQKDLLTNFKITKDCKIVFVTGTNGKSTTCGLLASILKKTGKKVICNKSGANLLSGIVSTFCHYSDLFGNLNCDFIILEVDEATLPILTNQLKPRLIAITNFFRDQLDRFGELDTTVKLIEKGINNNYETMVLLNGDDPRCAFIKTENRKIYYGLNKEQAGETARRRDGKLDNHVWQCDPEERTICPKCGSDFIYSYKTLAHLGNYKCSKCNLTRPEINFLISDFKADNLTINFDLTYNNHKQNYFLPMIGIFNLYNALCSVAIAKLISDITPVQIQKGIDSYSTIFGRGEKINVETPHQGVSTAWIYLIKNPTGTTEVLKTLAQDPNARFLIAINDNFADGRDVSWLWDVRFDILSGHKNKIYVSGKRASDMALRLKYADINENQIFLREKIQDAIKNATKSLTQNETLYILPTYTVLLEMQRRGICKGQPL